MSEGIIWPKETSEENESPFPELDSLDIDGLNKKHENTKQLIANIEDHMGGNSDDERALQKAEDKLAYIEKLQEKLSAKND